MWFQTGGPTWQVPTGRRDGLTSSAAAATLGLPSPSLTTPVLTQIFLAHGLTQDEMITLSGKTLFLINSYITPM